MRYSKKDILIALLVTLFIFTIAIVITLFFTPLYAFDISYLNITENASMKGSVVFDNYTRIVKYLSLLNHGSLLLPNFIISKNSLLHFAEVKTIFVNVQGIAFTSGIVAFMGVYHMHRIKQYRYLLLVSQMTLFPTLLLSLLALGDFEQVFIYFHTLIFNNTYWQFDSNIDPVIRILPESFFMHCFLFIVAIILCSSAICYYCYRKYQRKIVEN